jgi:hypothetical protein
MAMKDTDTVPDLLVVGIVAALAAALAARKRYGRLLNHG